MRHRATAYACQAPTKIQHIRCILMRAHIPLPPSSPFSPILHLLSTPLLHLSLSLTRPRLRHARSILITTPHTSIRRPGRIRTVGWDHHPQPPGPVAQNGGKHNAAIAPVYHVPHVFGQPLGVQVLTRAFDTAIRSQSGA